MGKFDPTTFGADAACEIAAEARTNANKDAAKAAFDKVLEAIFVAAEGGLKQATFDYAADREAVRDGVRDMLIERGFRCTIKTSRGYCLTVSW